MLHVNVSAYLFNFCESEESEILLGKPPSIFIDGELYKLREMLICARVYCVWQILAYEPELRFY